MRRTGPPSEPAHEARRAHRTNGAVSRHHAPRALRKDAESRTGERRLQGVAWRGKRLDAFQAGHLLYALVAGVEILDDSREYYGDIHSDNIILERLGLQFEIKLINCHLREGSARHNIFADVLDMISLFHEAIGGRKHYASQPPVVKEVCCGLKHSLIEKKFRKAGPAAERLLERLDWS